MAQEANRCRVNCGLIDARQCFELPGRFPPEFHAFRMNFAHETVFGLLYLRHEGQIADHREDANVSGIGPLCIENGLMIGPCDRFLHNNAEHSLFVETS
jgi:hypothetical protein